MLNAYGFRLVPIHTAGKSAVPKRSNDCSKVYAKCSYLHCFPTRDQGQQRTALVLQWLRLRSLYTTALRPTTAQDNPHPNNGAHQRFLFLESRDVVASVSGASPSPRAARTRVTKRWTGIA